MIQRKNTTRKAAPADRKRKPAAEKPRRMPGRRSILEKAAVLGRRHGFDEAHALQVTRLALSLFDQLASLHGLGPADRKILTAAGVLHDIGMAKGFAKHHKSSCRMILDAKIEGLSRTEKLLAANVARYHRKADPRPGHKLFAKLARLQQERVTKLSALLRLADVADRDHMQAVRDLRANRTGDKMSVSFEGKKPAAADAEVLTRKAALFEKVFELNVAFAGVEAAPLAEAAGRKKAAENGPPAAPPETGGAEEGA